MSVVDAFLDGLGEEARVAMRALVARAYDRGFREGLSAAGATPEEVRAPAVAVAPAAPPPAVTPEITAMAIAPSVPHDEPDSASVNWSEGPAGCGSVEAESARDEQRLFDLRPA